MTRKVLFLLLATLVVNSAQGTVSNGDTVQSQVAMLVNKLKSNEIERVEIIHMPLRILTRSRMTPQMLEKSFSYKLVIHDIRGSIYNSSLLAALTSASVKTNSEMGDVRWGITFFDQGERPIGSLYVDGTGHRGAVDTTSVSYGRPEISDWLNTNFSKAFK